jgi:acyl dehydratase
VALPREHLGHSAGRSVATVDPDRARAYAAATNDSNLLYIDSVYAPPVFGVVPTWDALFGTVTALVPAEHRPMLLHAEQDMHFHQPLVPGMTLTTVGEGYSVRVARSGTWLTVRVTSEDADGQLVLEQFATMFVRGMTGGESWGPERPDHTFVEEARGWRLGAVTRFVDADQTFRYAAASGDDNRIHVDDAFAKSVKLPGIIMHGLCTMAMCGAMVVDEVAGGDPSQLARLAVRFSKPAFPGHELTVSMFDAGDGVICFEATNAGRVVVKNGWAEVRG